MKVASQQKTGRIPPHKHCKVCGRAVPANKEYCSNECLEKDQRAERRARRMTRMYTLIFIILMVVLVIFSLISRPPG